MTKERSRSAEATVKGFMYQFDATILKILSSSDNATTVVEGIEDIDILNSDHIDSIQCKYYEGTSLTSSVLRDIVEPMLKWFLTEARSITYYIYGHFKKVSEFPLTDRSKFKREVLSYRKKGDVAVYNIADDLGATDDQLGRFLQCLKFEYAEEYATHQSKVQEELKTALKCTKADVEQLYYPAALSVVEGRAIKSNMADRSLTKKTFLAAIDSKNILYSRWYLEEQGADKFSSKIRKNHFSLTNIPPYERFFVVEWSNSASVLQIKNVVLELGRKWSTVNKSMRTAHRYAPYICIVDMPANELLELKNALYSEGHVFVDGYPFRESGFQFKNISMPQTIDNQIAFRFVEHEKLETVIANITSTKEIYEFYSSKTISGFCGVKHVRIPVENVSAISKMV